MHLVGIMYECVWSLDRDIRVYFSFWLFGYVTQDYAMLVLNNITRLQHQQQQQLEHQKKLSAAKNFDPNNNNNGWYDGNKNDVLKGIYLFIFSK